MELFLKYGNIAPYLITAFIDISEGYIYQIICYIF